MHFNGIGFRAIVKTVVAANAATATVYRMMIAALIQLMTDL